jgi:HK97 family phage portal protein
MPQHLELVRRNAPVTRVQKFWDSVRAYMTAPLTVKSPEIARLMGEPPSSTGMSVTPETAMTSSAFWSAVSMIADDIASLPLVLYKRDPKTGAKDRYETHPLYRVLKDSPNPEMTSMVFRRTIQAHALTWGGGYAEIVRNNANDISALWPLTPDRVEPFRRGADSPLQFAVRQANGDTVLFDQQEILHIPGLGFDGISGYSVIHKAKESLGLSLAAERFGGAFFGNGSTFGGVFSFKNGDPGEQTKENFRKAVEAKHQGIERSHKFLAIYADADYKRLGVPPNEAQFLETRVFQVREIARWFKIPPHKLGDLADATFSNAEQQAAEYYASCLRPWLEVWEQEIERKLIAPLERRTQFVGHVTEDFLRIDATARAALEQVHFSIGAVTPNELRQIENRDPIQGGDRSFVPLNHMPLDRLDEWIDAEIASKKPPPAPMPMPPTREQVDAFVQAVEVKLAERDAEFTALVTAKTAAEAQADTFKRESEALRGELEQERQLRSEGTVAYRSTLQALEEERDAAIDRAEQAEQDRVIANKELDTLRAQAGQVEDALREEQKARKEDHESSTLRFDVMSGAFEKAKERAEAAEQSRDTVEAVSLELRARIAVAEAAEAEARAAVVLAEAQLATITAERDASRQEVLVMAETQRTQKADNAVRWSVIERTRAAFRPVLVEALTKLITREADRARKQLASPEKFFGWLGTFYPMQGETYRQALRPVCATWQALTGQAMDVDAIVVQHLAQSVDHLRAAAQDQTPETLAPAIERVLRRWEEHRAEDLVAEWETTHGA